VGVTKLKSVSVKRRLPRRRLSPHFGGLKLPSFFQFLSHFQFPQLLAKKRSRWPLLIGLLFLLIAIPIVLWMNSRANEVAAWWNDSWHYRQRIFVNKNKVSGSANLQNFVVLISLTDTHLTKAQTNGEDFVFTDGNNQQLSHEIESYNDTTGALIAWVKVSELRKDVDTPIYLYYGNSTATDQQNSANTWTDYSMVYHLAEDSGTTGAGSVIDSSGHTAGTPTAGIVFGESGKVGPATDFSAGTGISLGTLGPSLLTETETISFWLKSHNYASPARQNPLNHSYAGWGTMTLEPNGVIRYFFGSGGADNSPYTNQDSTPSLANSNETWTHITMVRNQTGKTYTWYKNGVYDSGSTYNAAFPNITDRPFTIGDGYCSPINGLMDEFRIATVARSADWLATEYANQNDPTSFITPGAEEIRQTVLAYWSFDEGTGTTVKDQTRSGLNLNLTNATWKDESQCLKGKCLYFDGSGDYLRSTDSKLTTIAAGESMSYSVWFRSDDQNTAATYPNLLGIRKQSAPLDIFNLRLYQGYVQAEVYEQDESGFTANLSYATSLVDNRWHHAVLTKNGSDVTLYVDGVERASNSKTWGIITNTEFLVGSRSTSSGFYKGYLDEVKVFPYALSDQDMLVEYNQGSAVAIGQLQQSYLSEGLVGHWKMDETSSPSVNSSGNSNDLTWNRNVSSAIGKFSSGMNFDGFGDYAEAATDVLDVGTNSVSLATWIKASNTSAQPFIIDSRSTWGGTLAGITLSTTATTHYATIRLADGAIGPYEFAGTTSILDDEWHHVVGVIDRDQKKVFIYVDGQLQGNHDLNSALGSLSGSTAMHFGLKGTADSATNALNGTLDETRIYNRALKPDEVEKLYRFAPGPVGYWKMDEGSGTSTADSSGNGYTATIVNSPSWDVGKYGSSLNFDSLSDYMTVNNVPVGNYDWTISAWTKFPLANNGSWRTMLRNGGSHHHIIVQSDGQLGTYSPSFFSSGFDVDTLSAGWHYITAVGSGTTTTFYIDGRTVGVSNAKESGAIIVIGGIGSQNWGSLDDLRIYNYARTTQQIVQDMNAGHPTGGSPVGSQVSYWKFDESSGQAVNDTLGVQNGTLGADSNASTDDPTWKTQGECRVNGCLNFDGADHISVTSQNITTSGTATATFWIKLSASNNGRYIFSGTNCYQRPATFNASDNLGFYNGSAYVYGSKNLNDGNWHHVAIVDHASPSRARATYIDGELDMDWTDLTGTPYGSNTCSLGIIGGYTTVSNQIIGSLDELKFYSDVLTAEQIKLDMNQGASVAYGGTTSEAADLSDGAGDPPLSEWKFDEKTGSTVADISGNGDSLTLPNGATWKSSGECHEGACVSLDPTSSQYAVSSQNRDPGTSQTYEVWFNADSVASGNIMTIGATTGVSTSYHHPLLYFVNGTLYGCPWNMGYTSISTNISAGQWHHLAVVYNNSTLTTTYYLDGVAVATDNTGGRSTTSTQHIFFGATDTQTCSTPGYVAAYFDGKIDSAKIYNYARTPAQIAYDYNRGDPIAHWKLDECQGTTLNNSTGNSHSGLWSGTGGGTQTLAGTCTTADTAWGNGSTGKFNASLNFDGTDDKFTVATGNTITMGNDLTISTWVKTTAYSQEPILSTRSGGGGQMYLGLGLGKVFLYYNSASPASLSGTTRMDDGEWHHYVYVRSGSTTTLYLDGKQEATATQTSVSAFADVINVGHDVANNEYFPGQLDDIQIFNYALSVDQIAKLYNGSSAIRFED